MAYIQKKHEAFMDLKVLAKWWNGLNSFFLEVHVCPSYLVCDALLLCIPVGSDRKSVV